MATRDISDEDYLNLLTNQEREALTQFKSHSITTGFSDRRLMTFLFARKLRVDRAVTLLTNNLEFRKEHGIPVEVERSHLNDAIVKTQVGLFVPNTHDKEKRGLNYLIPARFIPANYPLADFYCYMMYLCDQTQWESPDYHRNGITMIEDLAGVSMKNVDSRMMKKKKDGVPAMEDIFPARVHAIFIVNAPFMLRAMLKIAKLVVKKKIIKRVKILPSCDSILEYVDKDQLHEHFGGTLQYSLE